MLNSTAESRLKKCKSLIGHCFFVVGNRDNGPSGHHSVLTAAALWHHCAMYCLYMHGCQDGDEDMHIH